MGNDLVSRLRDGDGPDAELQWDIHSYFFPKRAERKHETSAPYLISLDACIVLAEKVLPGMTVFLLRKILADTRQCPVLKPTELCRAFLIALITAKEASHDH